MAAPTKESSFEMEPPSALPGPSHPTPPHRAFPPLRDDQKTRRQRSMSERLPGSAYYSGPGQPDEMTPLIANKPPRPPKPPKPASKRAVWRCAAAVRAPVLASIGRRLGRGKSTPRRVTFGDDEESQTSVKQPWTRRETFKKVFKHVKIGVLFIVALTFSILYAAYPELIYDWRQYSVSSSKYHKMVVENPKDYPVLKLLVKGKLSYRNPTSYTSNLVVWVTNPASNLTRKIQMVFAPEEGNSPEITQAVNLDFTDEIVKDRFLVDITSNRKEPRPVSLFFLPLSIQVQSGVLSAAIILVCVYVLIVFDLVHRTLAAMLGALVSMAVLASTNEKPGLDRVITWLDYETLCLLFGMMVLVAILVDTGFFDWIALQAYRIAKGKTWPLITTLCIFSAFISAFLDNVTTILLLSPVTIRLCEVLDLDPKHVLMAEVLFSNIGGTATAIGDPPNVLIVSNKDIVDSGIDFGTFTLHMCIGSVLCAVAAYALLRFMYRKKALLHRGLPRAVAEMKHEAEVWRRAANQIVVTSREESTVKGLLSQKVLALEERIQTKMRDKGEPSYNFFKLQLEEMERRYKIRDVELLIKSGVVLGLVIVGFFLTSFIGSKYISIGWIPILGAVCLLLLADHSDLESILHRIEWATLLFFSALFVMMKALTLLGLIDWITTETTGLVMSLGEAQRLPVAIILIIWVSAICSSFIDNIPFTTAMLPVIVKLSGDPSVNLPLQPLVWSLAFGACLGGNGTLIGASANVVCAGIAETHGHKFSFWQFFKVGFPTMVLTVTVAMIYLLICHAAIGWQ